MEFHHKKLRRKSINKKRQIFSFVCVILAAVLAILVHALLPGSDAVKEKNQENKCTNKLMNLVEQIGRYGSMFLMVFNIGLAEKLCYLYSKMGYQRTGEIEHIKEGMDIVFFEKGGI